jgi:hypothetical protein
VFLFFTKIKKKEQIQHHFSYFLFDLSFHSLMIVICLGDFKDDRCMCLDVSFHVKRKMITSRETTVTVTAFEGLGSGVLSIVSRQFI